MGETNVEQPPHCQPNENNYTPEAPHLVLITHWVQGSSKTQARGIWNRDYSTMQTGLELEGDTGADFHPCSIPLPQKYCPAQSWRDVCGPGLSLCWVFIGGVVFRQCDDFNLMFSRPFSEKKYCYFKEMLFK